MESLDTFLGFVTNIIPKGDRLKRCKQCGKLKPISEFHRDRKSNDGHQSICKYCNIANTTIQNRKHRLLINEVKSSTGCLACGYNEDPIALDFHHFRDKEFEVSASPRIYLKTEEEILDEMNKCIVLCANCHRLKHRR